MNNNIVLFLDYSLIQIITDIPYKNQKSYIKSNQKSNT